MPTFRTMMSKTKSSQPKKKVKKVMREYKKGTLKSSSGKKVNDRKQALAIGLGGRKKLSY